MRDEATRKYYREVQRKYRASHPQAREYDLKYQRERRQREKQWNINVPPELHAKTKMYAQQAGVSMSKFIEEAVKEALNAG